jgi:carbonic anhydrase/acetyltransferase-like protein (isoleucine patch superfamily)
MVRLTWECGGRPALVHACSRFDDNTLYMTEPMSSISQETDSRTKLSAG